MAASETAVEVKGISFEEIDGDLAELTIELRTDVPAEALATLLRGLATFYKVGATLDQVTGDAPPDIWLRDRAGNGLSVPASDLFISQLVIGTPNKLKLVGRRRWMKDLTAFVRAGALAISATAGLVTAWGSAHGDLPKPDIAGSVVSSSTAKGGDVFIYPRGDTPASVYQGMTAAECMEEFNKLSGMRSGLFQLLSDQKIPVGYWQDQNAKMEKAQSDILTGLEKTGRCFPPKI